MKLPLLLAVLVLLTLGVVLFVYYRPTLEVTAFGRRFYFF
jgi:hypothetical protein